MDLDHLDDLYTRMLRIRLVEERIADLYPEQEMRCPIHLCVGQEATAVGVCAALEPTDYVFSNHRSHGHYLAKGGNLKALMAELYGKSQGCASGKGGSMHLVDLSVGFLGAAPVVASTIPLAVGAALTSKRRREQRVAVAFFGDAATEEGAFHESLSFAATAALPVLFVCENNLYSVYTGLKERQAPGRDSCALARAYGAEAVRADGNDVVEVLHTAQRAAAQARAGRGPVFLELATYRWREHVGPNYDNHLGYRTEQEFESWKARCPIQALERQLRDSQGLPDSFFEAVRKELLREIDDAVAFAKASPQPDPSLLMRHVYASASLVPKS